MESITISPFVLAVIFFVVAFIYSSVGLAGGSSYTALLAIFGFSALAIPLLSLTLNVIVSTVGSFNFIRHKHLRLKLILPFLISSIPMAYVGGSLHVPKTVFYWLLLTSLVLVALRIYAWRETAFHLNVGKVGEIIISLGAGCALGLISGIVGIGGGVYLIPLIIILGLGTEREAAACGVVFIWLNSVSGLISRFQYNAIDITRYVPLLVAVLIGGAVGSFLGSAKYSPRTMERILGVVIIIAIIFLSRKVISL
jgi:uncharacterized membrane protein YfcA